MKDFRNLDQLKAYLKKESERLNISIRNTYNTFFSRELLRRLSDVNYDKHIVVKGSFAQFVHLGKLIRPITDIDLTSNDDIDECFSIIMNMIDYNDNDIKYNIDGQIKRTYTGIYKLPIIARYDKLRHYIGIDYRENHPCIFEKQEKVVPSVFLEDEEYSVIVPSMEETLAEKLCIVVESNKPDIINTRVKDFYDVYHLHGGEYDLDKFSYYFRKMLEKRGKVNISEASTDHLTAEFIQNHRPMWDITKEKYEFLNDRVSIENAVCHTKAVLNGELRKVQKDKNKGFYYSRPKDDK